VDLLAVPGPRYRSNRSWAGVEVALGAVHRAAPLPAAVEFNFTLGGSSYTSKLTVPQQRESFNAKVRF
jgi:hypothetical protein